MTLADWVKKESDARKTTRKAVILDLAARSLVSTVTLWSAVNGARIATYAKARAISCQTLWQVSIPELCDDSITPEIAAQFNALYGPTIGVSSVLGVCHVGS